ncbi:MAG: hypothetical protein KAJ66_02790 [Candidatus Omnitrophica bacterium]|nr:hypothetical protein [Candidatus Omnitrophota bacterium]
MKRGLVIIVVCCFMFGLGIIGCSEKKVASSNEAIEASKSMETTGQKINYLIGQANTLYSSKEFQGAVDIAQYILRYVDKDSQEAKNLLEKAKEALIAKAQEAVSAVTEDVEKKVPGFGQ